MMDAKQIKPMELSSRRSRALAGLVAAVAVAALAGCGGGADTVQTPVTSTPPASGYSGPPPATADVQSFMINVWSNVKADNRCGGACHGGNQSPTFARQDDVNLAYAAANTVADLSSPADSRMVTKVGGGHNCWLTSNQACADILTTWIEGWAGAVAGGGREIQLTAPVSKDPAASKSFPASSALFGSTVHPLLTTYCAGCHANGAPTPQAPYFADMDVDAAYEAARSKISLDEPASSRFVLRLRNEFHNCWDDCPSNSTEMENAIVSFADQITPTQIDSSLFTSKALTLFEGTIASGGNRYEANQIALWEFKAGQGGTAFDTSGVEPALNLNFFGEVEWFGGWGINIKAGGKAQGSTTASRKVFALIQATGEYSIETWVVPGNVVQEEARIISYSGGQMARNFTLQQNLYNYEFQNRSSVTDGNGLPQLNTDDADEDLQATLQHVVATYDQVNGRRIYVNGVFTDDTDAAGAGTIGDWDDTFAFVLGSEVDGEGDFVGVMRLVAIHNRVLTDEQIVQNFDVGVGEKFFLLFGVEHLTSVPQSYIMFEAAQWDSYGYLFVEPTFISLDGSAQPDGVPIQGVRLGVNGQEVSAGQAYQNMDEMITSALYTPNGQPLSGLGTVIPLEKGPDSDEFFLTFDVIGGNVNIRQEPPPSPLPPPPDGTPVSDIGVRTFDEINATISRMTTVSSQNQNVKNTYTTIRQSLPTVETIEGFLSAHEMAIAQLGIQYCDALVEDTGLRSSYFPGFDFSAAANQAFDTQAERDLLIDPLLANTLGTGVGTAPPTATVKAELEALITRLTACGGSCANDRTETVAKAVCAGVVGSAAMLVQ